MSGLQGEVPDTRSQMDKLSADINRLKRLSGRVDPHLYQSLHAAWMSLCLLSDDRLTDKMNKTEHPGRFSREKTAGLMRAVQSLETACPDDEEIIKITEKIRLFLQAHPHVSGQSKTD